MDVVVCVEDGDKVTARPGDPVDHIKACLCLLHVNLRLAGPVNVDCYARCQSAEGG